MGWGVYVGSFWMSLLRESCRVCRSSPGVVFGDLVDVAACGSKIVLCISEQIYTLRGGLDGCEQMCTLHAVFVLGVCLRETWTVWRIVPCVHKMYTLGRFHGLLETFLFAVD